MTKRKYTRRKKAQPKTEPKPQPKYILVIDRFASWCAACKHAVPQEAKTCNHCNVMFTHVTTTCPLEWMPSTIQAVRKDLIWVDKIQIKNSSRN